MDARHHHRCGPGPAVGCKADAWSRATARDMLAEGCEAEAIVRKLTAYGLSAFSAQHLLLEVAAEAGR